MENFDSPAAPVQPTADQFQAQIDSLRQLVNSLLVLVVLISITFSVFLMRQWKTARTEANNLRGQIATVDRQDVAIKNFLSQLVTYGKAHTDFYPILTKYGLTNYPAKSNTPVRSAPTRK